MIEYKEIPGFPLYYAGSDGEIYSNNFKWKKEGDSLRKMKGGFQANGYKIVGLPYGDSFRTQRVHVLVCTAFHGPRPKGMECSHLNDIKTDNTPGNLKWETSSQNKLRKHENGKGDRGLNNSRSIFVEDDIFVIRELLSKNIPHNYIANIMNCSRTTILRIANNLRYGDVSL